MPRPLQSWLRPNCLPSTSLHNTMKAAPSQAGRAHPAATTLEGHPYCLPAVGAVYLVVGTIVAWLPIGIVGIIFLSRISQRGRGKGNAQDECEGDSHGSLQSPPRHKTVVKVSLYRWANKRAWQKARHQIDRVFGGKSATDVLWGKSVARDR